MAPDTILGRGNGRTAADCWMRARSASLWEWRWCSILGGFTGPQSLPLESGAGVLMDIIGPYYFTAMVALLGPITGIGVRTLLADEGSARLLSPTGGS